MVENIEYTLNLVWAILKRLVLVGVALYLAFRYGPPILEGLRMVAICVLGAVLLAYVLMPGVDVLCRRRVNRINRRTQRLLATIIVFLLFFSVIGGAIALAFSPASPLKTEAQVFVKKFGDYKDTVSEWVRGVNVAYNRSVPEAVQEHVERIDYSRLAAVLTRYAQQGLAMVTSSIGFLVELVLIPVLAFYFVFDHKPLTREVYGLVPRRRRREAIRIGHHLGQVLQRYIFGQLILCLIAGVLTAIVLAALDVPYVFVLAMFAAVTRAIPVIGPVLSGVPIVLVGLLSFNGPTVALVLAVFVTVMHFAESKFIMPQLIGERLNLHPAVVIIVLLIGAEFFGLIGMFLAAPAAAVIRELVRTYYIHPRRQGALAQGSEEDISTLIETRSAS